MIAKDFSQNGLTQVEAKKRLEKYGPNEIERKQESSWLKHLLDQFKSPLIYILVIAGVITLILGEWTDSVVIFLAVFVNAILGFFQETKAEKSLIALRKLIVPKAYVIRDGQEQQIEASQIVPGDLVVLKTGEKVSTDGALIEGVDLYVNEAILTGESVPVAKKKEEEIFMGTVVVSGRGRFLATKTGMETKMGKIAGGLQETIKEETPLKKKIASLSKILTLIFGIICILILLEGLLRGRHFLEMFELSIAIAVASIPEGLVISVTVILTLGMQRLLKQKALVRRLLAAETLGGVTVICADKTGTLTQGKMKVVDWAIEGGKEKEEEMMEAMMLCNNRTTPLELAIWEEVKKKQKESWIENVLRKEGRLDEIPFSSRNKFIATLHKNKLIVSGAPEKILAICDLSRAKRDFWQEKLDQFTMSGLRVVSFATINTPKNLSVRHQELNKLRKIDSKSIESLGSLKDLNFLGLLIFEDPVREEVKGALEACRKAGIKIKVITGDYRETAAAVINKLKITKTKLVTDQVIEGYELERMTDEELSKRVEDVVLFARTNPEDKIRIVRALQENGEVVAMMGDGVNDALALKQADIGIVVGEASEVAKEIADMVLLDSNFNTIVKAVKEGRGIFENIRKVTLYLLSSSFTELILISSSLIFGLPLPVLAVQILWVNLIQDGLPALALAFEPIEEDLMIEKPRAKEEPLLNTELKVLIFIIGIITDLTLLGIFIVLNRLSFNLKLNQTIIFAALGTNSLFYILSCKSLRRNLWKINFWKNKFLIIAIVLGFLFMFSAIYLPELQILLRTVSLKPAFLLIIFSFGMLNIALIEFVKWLFLRKRNALKLSF